MRWRRARGRFAGVGVGVAELDQCAGVGVVKHAALDYATRFGASDFDQGHECRESDGATTLRSQRQGPRCGLTN
jgi:hypothetical protein